MKRHKMCFGFDFVALWSFRVEVTLKAMSIVQHKMGHGMLHGSEANCMAQLMSIQPKVDLWSDLYPDFVWVCV